MGTAALQAGQRQGALSWGWWGTQSAGKGGNKGLWKDQLLC